ncbi:hypothetical protein KC19_6G034600 [Ceratodon purpureus]|uniref:GIL1/IRKI C-terminal domain-containing protein n=1 Tax=Ceratodon purpureus TaxID=3225 RepID=A0A8T0HB36_CERPU|nr:hypothetical protein KC19_6G034600 [Ceratodon purpureus]
MRGLVGTMGMQKAGGLLGVHGDTMLDSSAESRARARRIMAPQREYPIFTPGFREPAAQTGSSDQSQTSFQDSDGQGIWKEIHTDTQSTAGHSSHSISFETGHMLTPSVSATSLQNSPYADYMEPPPLLCPSTGGTLPSGTLSMNSSANYYNAVPNTPPQRNYNIPGVRASPATTTVPHSPQNVNILSPQLRPLERSPKRTQLHIASPRLTENGGLTPMVNQLTLSPEQTRPDYDPTDAHLSSNMLPPASLARSPHQVTLGSPVHTPVTSTMKLKKMMKSRQQADQSPRPSIGKDRSPGRTWKKSFRSAASPALASVRDDQAQNQSVRGMTREMNNSFQGNKPRPNAVNPMAAPSWRGADGGQMLAPVLSSQEFSGEIFERSDVLNRVGGKKLPSTQKSGSYNIFNFLSWGKKKAGGGGGTTPKQESFLDSDLGSVKADSDSIKVLDYTIKTLRYKVEQANQKRAAAMEEVRALQAAVEASDEKCRQLTRRCQELELKLSARSSGLWDTEFEEPRDSNATYIVGRREPTNSSLGPARRFSSMELTPEQFLRVFEDSIASIRKLASAICIQIREMGESATQVITTLLEQHKVGRAISRMPRNVIILYFESFLNQVMFESFENVSFEPNGASSVFDPDTLKQTCYQSYQNLKNQEWTTIEKSLGKPGALVVNTNFHRFFVVRMELILSQLGKLGENEISLNLMAAFFNSVKAVWLVHHMAFAFDQPVSIFRVSPASDFDARFMEQVTAFDQDLEPNARSKISIMLNPGFIVNRQIIKCQVYCSSKYD